MHNQGYAPLAKAGELGHLLITEALLDAKADVKALRRVTDILSDHLCIQHICIANINTHNVVRARPDSFEEEG